jgi:hypothetical protein
MTPRILFAAALLLATAGAAAAQTTGGPSSGPLVIERIESQFVVAPEYKFTDVNGRTGHMVGVSAGVLNDKSLYLGGAIYFLTNGSDDFGLTYGGLLTGWTAPVGSHLRVGGRGLFGFGGATLGDSTVMYDPRTRVARTYHYWYHEDFVFAEPQAQAHVAFADHVGIDVTAGYRFAGWEPHDYYYSDGHHDGVDGATGALAVQIGW